MNKTVKLKPTSNDLKEKNCFNSKMYLFRVKEG